MRLDGTLTPPRSRDDQDPASPSPPSSNRTPATLADTATVTTFQPGAAPDCRFFPSLASNSKLMKNKKRKITSTASPPLPSATTIASLPDEVVEDILLRLPSAAAICRAIFASEHWIRVASSPTFLRRLRDVHDYPLLLGHFISRDDHGSTAPRFYSEADGLVAAMVRRGDFLLARIRAQGPGQHVLEDCRGGRLLFSYERKTLTVFNPMTHRVSSVEQLPRRGGRGADHRDRTLCLLPNGDDPDAFRVISIKHGKGKRLGRLEVYDSSTRAWRVFPEAGTAKIPLRTRMAKICRRGQYSPAMHAGDRIFWNYADAQYSPADSLLSLDAKTMTFSEVLLPPGVWTSYMSTYAVGEKDDGTCCLVHVFKDYDQNNEQMQVWRFKVGDDHAGNGAQMWELERQVPLILESPSAPRLGVDKVRAIVGGIVLLCFKKISCYQHYQHHIAFRLKSLKVEADFECHGLARPFVIE